MQTYQIQFQSSLVLSLGQEGQSSARFFRAASLFRLQERRNEQRRLDHAQRVAARVPSGRTLQKPAIREGIRSSPPKTSGKELLRHGVEESQGHPTAIPDRSTGAL